MAKSEKLCELEQKRTKLHVEAREIAERSEKENRAMSKDEDSRFVAILGPLNGQGGELFELDQRIANLDRLNALDRIGVDSRSGRDPFVGGDSRLGDPLPHEDPSNTKNGKHKYNLMAACRAKFEGHVESTLEGEVSAELCKRTDTHCRLNGFKMPHRQHTLSFRDIDTIRRAMDVTDGMQIRSFGGQKEKRALDSGAGAGSIPTLMDRDWIEILRNKMVLIEAGAREILDLKGKFAIPRQNAAAIAYWVAESAAPTGTNQTLDQVLFTPHTIGAFTDISRRFFELTILDSGVGFVEDDLTEILARGLDLAGLNGAGNSYTPLGILQNPGITSTRTVSGGTNGGVPTWPNIVELHTIVARGNAAGLGETSYIGNADVEGTLATTLKVGSTFPVYLLGDDGKLFRKELRTTMQLPNNLAKGNASGLSPLMYGVFNQAIFAYWSGVDILVDPYTGSSTGTIRIVALMDLDFQVRHNEAFSVMVDVITNQSQ